MSLVAGNDMEVRMLLIKVQYDAYNRQFKLLDLELVHALAAPQPTDAQHKTRTRKKVSLVDTPFCGMWADREDITDEQIFARQLRRRLETRGDSRKNVR